MRGEVHDRVDNERGGSSSLRNTEIKRKREGNEGGEKEGGTRNGKRRGGGALEHGVGKKMKMIKMMKREGG